MRNEFELTIVDYPLLKSHNFLIVNEMEKMTGEDIAESEGWNLVNKDETDIARLKGKDFVLDKLESAHQYIKDKIQAQYWDSAVNKSQEEVRADIENAIVTKVRLLLYLYKRANMGDLSSGEVKVKEKDQETVLSELRDEIFEQWENKLNNEINASLAPYLKYKERDIPYFITTLGA